MTPAFRYAEPPDVPEGMTLAEYRRLRCARPRARLFTRMKRRVRRAASVRAR